MSHTVERLQYCRNCHAWLWGDYCARCGQKVAALNPALGDLVHDVIHEFLHVDGKIFRTVRWPRAMFLLVPLSAGLVHLVTRKTGKNYPQHLYFALHVHAAYFAVLVATTILGAIPAQVVRGVAAVVPLLFAVVYSLVAFRRAYGGTWSLAAGRLALVLATYMMAVGVALVGVAVLVTLTA